MGFAFLICSNFSKSPWVLQNVWYIWRNWRSDIPRWYLFVAGVLVVGILGQGLIYYGEIKSGATSPTGELGASGFVSALFVLLVPGLKILEAMFLAHIPFPAFYKTVPVSIFTAIVMAYFMASTSLIAIAFKSRRNSRNALEFLGLVLLMSIPFAANSNAHVISPIVPLIYFAWISLLPKTRKTLVILSTLLILNLMGTLFNYHLSDT